MLLPSPLQKVEFHFGRDFLYYFKREDLIDPIISGNKWRKLKYNIDKKQSHIVTLGGAFSNHILAVAKRCYDLDIHSTGIIRGELDNRNPTLSTCKKLGMRIVPVPRNEYAQLSRQFQLPKNIEIKSFSFIPEGGTNLLAIRGMQEVQDEILNQLKHTDFTVMIPWGTGGSSMGFLSHKNPPRKLIIYPAILGLTHKSINKTLERHDIINQNYEIRYSTPAIRYARKDMYLFHFIEEFLIQTGLLLDPIYTGKMLYSHVLEEKSPTEDIVIIHTGGIQAWNGYFYRFPRLKDELPKIHKKMEEFNLKADL